MARFKTIECLQQGHRVWLRFGLFCRLWLFRVAAVSYVLHVGSLGFGFGPLRSARRWFRLSLMSARVWCRFLSFAFGLGFGCPAPRWFRFILFGFCPSRLALVSVVCGGFVLFSLFSAPRVGRLREKLTIFRCKLAVFK